MRALIAAILLTTTGAWIIEAPAPFAASSDAVRFAVIGDSGTGDRYQYEVAQQLIASHHQFPFELVIMLGDNIYGRQEPEDLARKFEEPYRPLLDAGVRFYADEALAGARDDWKICYFHHPLYSDGGRHGSEVDLRVVLEPMFVRHGVNVVFSGHDHLYERLKPQRGIYYFVSGAAGQLRKGNLRASDMTAAAFDQDQSFMLVEIAGAEMSFQAISRTGKTVDSGVIHKEVRP